MLPSLLFQESKGHESKELPNEEGRKSEDENDEVQEAGRAGQKSGPEVIFLYIYIYIQLHNSS